MSDSNPFAAPEADPIERPERFSERDALLAERWTRFWGSFVDNLLYSVAAAPGLGFMFAIAEEQVESIPAWIAVGAPVVLLWIYQMYSVTMTGQTIAKKWFKMKIVKLDGSPVTFSSGVVLRSWVPGMLGMIPKIGGLIGLVDALMIFGDARACLHDRIAFTKVIDVSLSDYQTQR